MKKTYLGLALDEVLEDLGLEHLSREIGVHFKEAFIRNISQMDKNIEPIKIVGNEEDLKESPIGTTDQHSCFAVLATKIKYKGHIEFLNNKATTTTCIEAFSDNKKKIKKEFKNSRKLPRNAMFDRK